MTRVARNYLIPHHRRCQTQEGAFAEYRAYATRRHHPAGSTPLALSTAAGLVPGEKAQRARPLRLRGRRQDRAAERGGELALCRERPDLLGGGVGQDPADLGHGDLGLAIADRARPRILRGQPHDPVLARIGDAEPRVSNAFRQTPVPPCSTIGDRLGCEQRALEGVGRADIRLGRARIQFVGF